MIPRVQRLFLIVKSFQAWRFHGIHQSKLVEGDDKNLMI